MANTITKTTLEDGVRNLVVLVNISGDGSGDESKTLLIDRSTYAPTDGLKLVVVELNGMLDGFTAKLEFDGTTDLQIAGMPNGQQFEFDWDEVGGIASSKAGAGYNGDILLTTTGLGANERGTFTLFMRKA